MTLGTMPWVTPKPGSIIILIRNDIDILKPDGTTPCEDGEKGENRGTWATASPSVFSREYYRDEELTRQENGTTGFYHTGDVAWRDEDGYYWFEGRIRRRHQE